MSAMSNGATFSNKPFGYLIWGVEDITHYIKGTNFSFFKARQGNQDLELWLRNLLHPKINFEIFEFLNNEKHIVLSRIPSAKGEPTHFQKKPHLSGLEAIKPTLETFRNIYALFIIHRKTGSLKLLIKKISVI
ncbi:MAG: ATP-binding protein [Candidatus Woesebacteria bacterium]|nr:ATP-binding protein [Candidatus Woesebacteria bacterium]